MTHSLPHTFDSLEGLEYEIDRETGCWNWLKSKTARGYALRHMHRVYWERVHGPIPQRHQIHHICENPSCVNPDHLECLTQREHIARHVEERYGLSYEDVKEMRRLHVEEGVSMIELGERYGKSYNNVWYLLSGYTYKELGGYVRPIRDCDFCGKPITTGNRHKKYCDKVCRVRFNRWKNGGGRGPEWYETHGWAKRPEERHAEHA